METEIGIYMIYSGAATAFAGAGYLLYDACKDKIKHGLERIMGK